MPQIKIQQTPWGRQLICTLLKCEHLDESHLNQMTADPASRLLCPFVRRTTGGVQLMFQLTGLSSLPEIQLEHALNLMQWLMLLKAVSETLATLADAGRNDRTFLDPAFIFFSGPASAEPDIGRPMLLGKPIVTTGAPTQTARDGVQHTVEFLAALAEPAIDLAQDSALLTPEQADRLLVSVWESPNSFLAALDDCLYSLRSKQPQTAADAPPGMSVEMSAGTPVNLPPGPTLPDVSVRGPVPTDDWSPPAGGAKHRVRRILLLQIAALGLAGAAAGRMTWPPLYIRLLCGAVLTIFLLLDVLLLLHPHSPLQPPETRRRQAANRRHRRNAAAARQKSSLAAALDQASGHNQTDEPGTAPPAELLPVELAYLGSDGDAIRCRQAFTAATVADAVLTVGANPVTSDLCLPTADIGDQHAEIRRQGAGHCLVCFARAKNKPGSEQRTWLNGLLLTGCEPAELKDGDIIRFGRYIYRYQLNRRSYLVPNSRSPASPSPGMM